jgi:hypothetical protein
MGRERLSQQLRAFDAEPLGPSIGLGYILLFDTKADHDCHTLECTSSYRANRFGARNSPTLTSS